jgi:oligopeptide transport system substrate-binding protein
MHDFFRHRLRLRSPLRLLLAALSLGAVGCRDQRSMVEQANTTNTLLLANGTELADLDPQIVTGSPESRVVLALFEGLVRYDPVTLDPLPGVAESWEIDDDGVTYTFHLRADAKWSDGVAVTAHDFVSAFERILAPAMASENSEALYFMAGATDFNQGLTNDFGTVGCRAIDPRTLEIRAARPTPFLLRMMSARTWFPVPVHVLEKHNAMRRKGTVWTRPENIVGNGPYVLTEWKQNQFLQVSRSPTYWNRSEIKLDHIKFFPIESQTSEEAAYRASQLHRTVNVPVNKIDTYRRERPDELRIAPFSGTYYYSFNTRRPPLDDARVRRALAMAIDRAAITREITRAGETPAHRFTPDGVSGYHSTVPGVSIDLEQARKLLAEAGYPGGEGFPSITLLYNTAENHRVIAEAVQQMWRRELGVDIQLENQEWKVYLDSIHLGNFDISRNAYIVAPDDPTRFLESTRTGHGFNVAGWSNADYDRLLRAALDEVVPEKRWQIFTAMEELLFDEMPVAPIYHYTNKYLIRPEVKNWTDNMLNTYPLREVVLEP